ncbi:hypothetical protein [Citrobacter freundii]|uniref:Uncharacterized protein n=1 Tax=Citrobacter freundii TaxID=546 RepID=A0A7G2IVY5_CITFR|nr:hypothetical protein [Citrobacter freundii]
MVQVRDNHFIIYIIVIFQVPYLLEQLTPLLKMKTVEKTAA